MCPLLVHDKPAGKHPRAHSCAQEGTAVQVQVLREGLHIQGQQEAARRYPDLPQEIKGFGRLLKN